MKRIVVSQRIDWVESHQEFRDSVDRRLIRLLFEADLLPIPLPNLSFEVAKKKKTLDLFFEAINPDGILLSGGNDIGQFLDRDNTEFGLLQYAATHALPVLGVCRGMQLMAAYDGIEVVPVSGHSGTRHKVSGDINGEFNSFHKFSIARCPPNFRVIATAHDGEIEAIRHKFNKWEGWMWHPEREENPSSWAIENIARVFKS